MYTLKTIDKLALEIVAGRFESKRNTERFFNDPSAWVEYMTGMKFWSRQDDIAQAVVHNRNVAVKAAHGTGKSQMSALLIVWWIDTRYPNAFVASTAPSQAQISAIVWRYVRQIKALIEQRYKEGIIDHKLPGYITADNQWKEEGGNILGFGRKPPDNKEDDSFQGLHDAYVLAVGDEGVGLTGEMIDALGNITSNENSRRFIICNPTNPSSYIGKLFKEQPDTWNFQTISAFDSPNFTEERHTMDPEVLEKLVGPSYVEDKKAEYGEDSPRYKARVLGEFAYDLGDTLIKESDVTVAMDTEFFIPAETSRRVLGCDVSRYGDDFSVVYLAEWTLEGLKKVRYLDSWGEAPTTESAKRIHKLALDHAVQEVRVDGHGLGGGVLDNLELEDGTYHIIDMNSNATTSNRKQWHNARAYWWDTMRSELRKGQIDVDHEDETLRDELCSVEYGYSRQSGGLLIESKDDMRKRGAKSPDYADAAIYACADMSHLFDGTVNSMAPGTVVDMTYDYDYEPDWFIEGMI